MSYDLYAFHLTQAIDLETVKRAAYSQEFGPNFLPIDTTVLTKSFELTFGDDLEIFHEEGSIKLSMLGKGYEVSVSDYCVYAECSWKLLEHEVARIQAALCDCGLYLFNPQFATLTRPYEAEIV